MSRELIEKMARALCAYDVRLEPDEIGDPGYEAQAASHVDECWRNYVGDVGVILSLLADPANITDEMVEAAARELGMREGVFAFGSLPEFAKTALMTKARAAIAAAFSERAGD